MSSTQFQTRPPAVAQLTTSEFTYNLELNDLLEFDAEPFCSAVGQVIAQRPPLTAALLWRGRVMVRL